MKWMSRVALSPVQIWCNSCEYVSLTPPGQCWTPALQLQRCHGQKKILSSWCHPPGSGGLSEPGGEREQVMSKLSPKNNTFSFYETGWRRPKTILGKKCSVEITEEGRRVLHLQPGAGCTENANIITSLLPVRASKKRDVQTAEGVWCTLKLVCQAVASMTNRQKPKVSGIKVTHPDKFGYPVSQTTQPGESTAAFQLQLNMLRANMKSCTKIAMQKLCSKWRRLFQHPDAV